MAIIGYIHQEIAEDNFVPFFSSYNFNDGGIRANNMVGVSLRVAPSMLARYDVFLFPAS